MVLIGIEYKFSIFGEPWFIVLMYSIYYATFIFEFNFITSIYKTLCYKQQILSNFWNSNKQFDLEINFLSKWLSSKKEEVRVIAKVYCHRIIEKSNRYHFQYNLFKLCWLFRIMLWLLIICVWMKTGTRFINVDNSWLL